MGRKKNDDTLLGIASYKPEDWAKLRKISSDVADLEDTWLEWLDSNNKFEQELGRRNIRFVNVEIDLDELILFCERNRCKINADSRARYVVEKMKEIYG